MIQFHSVSKFYPGPSGEFAALKDVDLTINAGEFTAIVGKSGSGKSTLMNLLTGIDRLSSGRLQVAGTDLGGLGEKELTRWRGKNVGVVFQFFQLLPTLTILENVLLPMDFCNTYPSRERLGRAMALLESLGIADQAEKLPSQLSGGQQQRSAIARALANDPPIIAADEPTGNLDSRTADMVFQSFLDLKALGKTIVMVTHERSIGDLVDREIFLKDGMILSQEAVNA